MATQKMTHPNVTGRGKTIEVDADMVPMYESQGWQKKDDSGSSSSKSGSK